MSNLPSGSLSQLSFGGDEANPTGVRGPADAG
jgi:hypothetical protein